MSSPVDAARADVARLVDRIRLLTHHRETLGCLGYRDHRSEDRTSRELASAERELGRARDRLERLEAKTGGQAAFFLMPLDHPELGRIYLDKDSQLLFDAPNETAADAAKKGNQ